jgi:hypothetical protein
LECSMVAPCFFYLELLRWFLMWMARRSRQTF